ncbi:methyl-accepting chemotaxis protein [Cytobacillus sp. S13-E01]|uniref:methyl-accepting chemotaxis protein n=1 Tax=Cytobacillus sp. S13-E01 TaxID=3031326 RepID=UPI0023D8116B|nr:methyl-accepting chemotaxis protein [Cytobacillus sp. S13-E01]
MFKSNSEKSKKQSKLSSVFNKTIRRQILIPFLSLIILSGTIISFVAYQFSVSMTTEELSLNVKQQMSSMNDSFEIFFTNTENTINLFSEKSDLKSFETTEDKILASFEETASSNEQITNIYMGTATGKMILYPSTELPSDYDPRTRVWYTDAIENKDQIIWTEPYIDTATNEVVVSVAKAVYNGSTAVGVMSIDISVDTLIGMISKVKIGESGYAVLFDNLGKYLAHPDKENIGVDVSSEQYYQMIKKEGNDGIIEYDHEGQAKIMAFVTNEKTGWQLAGTVFKDELEQKAQGIILPILIALGVVLIFASLIAIFVTRKFVEPIKTLQDTMKNVENGDLTATVMFDRQDEVGQLAQSFNQMILQMKMMIQKVSTIADNVTDASQTLVASAEENTAASNEVATTMEEISAGATNQTELIEANSQATNLLADKIQQVEDQAKVIQTESNNMEDSSKEGMNKVRLLKEQFSKTNLMASEMAKAVSGLDENSTSINDIVKKIAEIAGQTNLLALNAAIEAARAGEAGKGFAVVAEEVRKLAEQTEGSLKDISAIIGKMQGETSKTVHLIRETNEYLVEQGKAVDDTEESFSLISAAITSSRSMIQGIVDSVKEMVEQRGTLVRNAHEITSISQETAAGTEQVSASIEETTASMEQLNMLASELDSFAKEMNDEIRKFSIEEK